MLIKIKIPLPDMLNAVLALDSSALDIDQVENLMKFCPTKEEMETLRNYNEDKEMLGKCKQFFLELMQVPRVESKEVKESAKLRQIMQTILTLGNALNQGTARGSAVGFKLDSLLKLSDTQCYKQQNDLDALSVQVKRARMGKTPYLVSGHVESRSAAMITPILYPEVKN
uniref:Formin-like protein 14 isoform X3 n=1 Tax=Nicotiana tabacum TaxID=4097 RepID=A0A1S3YY74_TOBAC|nr:PREDICTED: formin-like protein 14 isoform X3 [Nicotiana tabacum]